MASTAKPFPRIAAVFLAALALCWAAALNGQPFLHPDSLSYVRGPDVALSKLLGPRFATEWSRLDPAAAAQKLAGHAAPATPSAQPDHAIQAGRSVYYGVLADLGAHAGGFWLTVALQALAVAALVEIVLRGLGLTGRGAYAGVMALLTLATPAAFFVGLIMPDIWAGLAIGALAALFALAGRLRPLDSALLAAFAAFGGLAHSSVAPVLAVLILAGALAWLIDRRRIHPWPGLVLGALALAATAAGGLAFSALVRHTTGSAPLSPPFLTARLVADGPGERFIKSGCGGQAFVVCRYADRLPMDADHFLWGLTERDGVVQTVGPAERRALADEQVRFALAVLRAYPLQQVRASAWNALRQVGDTDLSDFDYKPSLQASFAATLPPKTMAVMRRTRAWAQAWPVTDIWRDQTVALGALVLVLTLLVMRAVAAPAAAVAARPAAKVLAWRGGAAPGPRREPALLAEPQVAATRFLILVVVGVLANAAICGALSDINGRYQARVVWCLALALLAWILTRLDSRDAPRPGLRVVTPA